MNTKALGDSEEGAELLPADPAGDGNSPCAMVQKGEGGPGAGGERRGQPRGGGITAPQPQPSTWVRSWVRSTSSLGIEIFSSLVPYCQCGGGDPFFFDSVYDFPPPHHFAQQHRLQKPVMIPHGFNLRTGVS